MTRLTASGVALALIFVAVALTRFWGPTPTKADSCPSLERLQNEDGRADALAEIERGDYHLLMLGGFVPEIPGIGSAMHGTLPSVMLEHTSDTETVACSAARHFAEDYASKYNETVLSKRR